MEPEAADELDQAALWYEQRRADFGSEFLEAVDTALDLIDRFPQAGHRVVHQTTRIPRGAHAIPKNLNSQPELHDGRDGCLKHGPPTRNLLNRRSTERTNA